ncbi:DUF6349 family protein [Gulosibacter molinativorax]|uniref:Uncharacterized protein n=1 Tax=Gulosibacter molinativorax TaxID=256821 RepID=A0ABT7C500_9MICO|nr:DUF6349 family protein [Gulosibacter molinativorax]MDJ1370265.1 hypothetical protein [Gulosibacter molinativorax]QUY61681.1 Hypotetical protein [Gulosibacter molinativorax]
MNARTAPGGQLAFDLDAMIHEADVQQAPAWEGAPLHFTADYYAPDDLTAAFERWVFEHGNFGCLQRSHMWHPGYTTAEANTATVGHELRIFDVDLRCTHYREDCSCVGGLLTRGICAPCRWHLDGNEATIVEAWHDHAWPGWRTLPVIPASIAKTDDQNRPTKKYRAWIDEHYPAEWQLPGAPIITERQPYGTRHVPGRSPWQGFDLSHTALTTEPQE